MSMKLNLKNKSLSTILYSIKGIVPLRPVFPVQGMVLISPQGKDCFFYTNGPEAQIRYCSDSLSFEKPEKKLISVFKLFEISRNFSKDSNISISFNGSSATVSCEGSTYKLKCLPPNDFPETEEPKSEEMIEVAEQELKYLLEKTDFCIAKHDPRHYLNGLLFSAEDSKLSAVSTDSHRLAISTVPISMAAKTEGILPRDVVLEAKGLLSETKDPAKIAITSENIIISLKNIQISAKRLNGQFPNYSKIIPREFLREIVLDRENFLRSLQRASAILATSALEDGLQVTLVFSKKKLLITSRTSDGEEASVEQTIDYEDDTFEISFNSKYLQDVMKALDTKNICLQMRDASSGVRIIGEGSTMEEYVVMPLRI